VTVSHNCWRVPLHSVSTRVKTRVKTALSQLSCRPREVEHTAVTCSECTTSQPHSAYWCQWTALTDLQPLIHSLPLNLSSFTYSPFPPLLFHNHSTSISTIKHSSYYYYYSKCRSSNNSNMYIHIIVDLVVNCNQSLPIVLLHLEMALVLLQLRA
jgi:hypothetical protein